MAIGHLSKGRIQWAPPEAWGKRPLERYEAWIRTLCGEESFRLRHVLYVGVDDGGLAERNAAFLDHHDWTDVLTFAYGNGPERIEGEVWMSLERIAENARKRDLPEEEELLRVLAHGLYHLSGMTDHSLEERQAMREKEDGAIRTYRAMFHVEQ